MRGIDKKEHQNLQAIFEKYKHAAAAVEVTTLDTKSDEDFKISNNMEELAILYSTFTILLFELQRCINDYELKKKSTRSILYKKLRQIKAVEKK